MSMVIPASYTKGVTAAHGFDGGELENAPSLIATVLIATVDWMHMTMNWMLVEHPYLFSVHYNQFARLCRDGLHER
jgi:hypothetical protein